MIRLLAALSAAVMACGPAFAQGRLPSPSFGQLTVNLNPGTEAPAYTSGRTADHVVGNSQYGLSTLWPLLDGGTQHDGIAGISRIVPTTTVTQVNALAGYVDNANPNNVATSVGVGVAVGAFGVNRVDGAQTWMYDGILTDVGSSGSLGRLMQSEWDYKPRFANTSVNGLINVIDGPVQTNVADAFTAGSTYNGTTNLARWHNGFRTYPGQVETAFLADQALAAGVPNSNSQPISMNATDGGGVQRTIRLIVEGSASSLVLDRADGAQVDLTVPNGNVNLGATHGVLVNGTQVVGGTSTGFQTAAGQAPVALLANLSAAPGASVNSQSVGFKATTAGSVVHTISVGAQGSAGALVISREDSAPVNLVLAGGGSVNTQFAQFSPSQSVSALPTCNSGNAGKVALVGDALTPTWNGTLTGGGAVLVLALCNGANWTAH